MLFGLDLWNPQTGLALWAVLGTAFLLGMVHGVTPDEHTWPITFSYAVGGYSSRAGIRSALTFSMAFLLQRAIASELAYLALARFLSLGSWQDFALYVVVGAAMVWAARYIRGGRLPWHLDVHLHRLRALVPGRRRRRQVHVHTHGGVDVAPAPHWSADGCEDCGEPDLEDPRPWMPALHGFIAGWGLGAFAVVIYSVLAPSMPSAWWGWVPGALFGLGTMAVQVLVGALVGWLVRRKGAPPDVTRRIGLVVAARTLGIGGAAFVLAGVFGLLLPGVASWQLSTGVHVHNLDSLGLPLALVVVSVAGVGLGSLVTELRRVPSRSRTGPGAPAQEPAPSEARLTR
jgi:ABC-type nickel/cobalt efflux system permease component RcnA